MSISAPLHSIATSLDTYRTQFAALGNALSALRVVSDQMIAQLDRDREALETHLQTAIAIEAAAQAEADMAITAAPITEQMTAADEVQTVTELPGELAVDPQTEAAVQIEKTVAVTSVEPDASSADETTPTESEALPSKAVIMESKAETEASTSDVAAPSAESAETEAIATSADAEKNAPTSSGIAAGESKVISLADRRKAHTVTSPARRRAKAFVASILVTAGATFGLHELLQSELGQRMLELGTCDGDMLSATRDCSLLAWLTI